MIENIIINILIGILCFIGVASVHVLWSGIGDENSKVIKIMRFIGYIQFGLFALFIFYVFGAITRGVSGLVG